MFSIATLTILVRKCQVPIFHRGWKIHNLVRWFSNNDLLFRGFSIARYRCFEERHRGCGDQWEDGGAAGLGPPWGPVETLSNCTQLFAESNVANQRSSANEGDEGSESNESRVYRSQAMKAMKAMKTLKTGWCFLHVLLSLKAEMLLGLQFGGSKPSSGLG